MNLHDPVVADTARYYAERERVDKFEDGLRDDPIWDYLSPKQRGLFGCAAMSIAQECVDDECEAGRKLVRLLREYAPSAFRAMKEEAEEMRGDR